MLGWIGDDIVPSSVHVCVCGDIGLVPSLWGVPGKGVTSGAGNT